MPKKYGKLKNYVDFRKLNDTTTKKWRTPKFLIRPTWGSRCVESRKVENLEPLLTSSTKGGKRGVLEVPGLD